MKSISYLKANTAEVLRQVNDTREPIVITQNGEAKAVVQDVVTYEQQQASLALLKLIGQGKRSLANGQIRPLRAVVAELHEQLKQRHQ